MPTDVASTPELAEAFQEQIPTESYPHLARFTIEHVLQQGFDYGNEFEFGLDLVLDGLERALRSEGAHA